MCRLRLLAVAVLLCGVLASEDRRRAPPDIGRAFKQGVAKLKLAPWAGANAEAAEPAQKAAPVEDEATKPAKASPMLLVCVGLFTLAFGALVAEQVFYGHLTSLGRPTIEPPSANALAAVPAASATAPSAETETDPPPSSAKSDTSDFEMVNPTDGQPS